MRYSATLPSKCFALSVLSSDADFYIQPSMCSSRNISVETSPIRVIYWIKGADKAQYLKTPIKISIPAPRPAYRIAVHYS